MATAKEARKNQQCTECGQAVTARSLCSKHYQRFRAHGDAGWPGKERGKAKRYLVICKHGLPRQYVHRAIMEKHLGRPLLRSEHVHHINHNRSDNRIENLQLLDPTTHYKLHVRPKTRFTCVVCKKTVLARRLCLTHYQQMRIARLRFIDIDAH